MGVGQVVFSMLGFLGHGFKKEGGQLRFLKREGVPYMNRYARHQLQKETKKRPKHSLFETENTKSAVPLNLCLKKHHSSGSSVEALGLDAAIRRNSTFCTLHFQALSSEGMGHIVACSCLLPPTQTLCKSQPRPSSSSLLNILLLCTISHYSGIVKGKKLELQFFHFAKMLMRAVKNQKNGETPL